MALIVIDHGQRIQSPVKTLFPARGVDSLARAKATHDSAGTEKHVHADGEDFITVLQSQRKEPAPLREAGANTYTDLSKKRAASDKKLRAAQIMSSPVQSIPRETTFKGAWMRMQELHISHLMVTDSDEKPVGIITREDIMEHGKDSPVSIANFYTRQLIAASPDTELNTLSNTLLEYDINALPIFDDNNQLLGIVCRADLLRMLVSGAHIEGWA